MPIDKYLEKLEGARASNKAKLPNSTDQDNSSYILLPETNSHPDILVEQTRLIYSPIIKQIVKSLNINPKNNENTEPLYKDGYLGLIDYDPANNINTALGGFTLPLNLFVEFLNILKSGDALDENNKPIDQSRIVAILDDILKVRSPRRAEWLNGRYQIQEKNGKKTGRTGKITHYKFDPSSKLVEVEEELLEDTLLENKKISLDDWLRNPTSQGLPRKDVVDGELLYWFPRNNDAIAVFIANPTGAVLSCDGGPRSSGSWLGVRYAKIKS